MKSSHKKLSYLTRKMPIIIVQPDCGNAPRKIFLKDFIIAIAEGNLSHITESVPEEIVWEILGFKTVTGKQNLLKELKGHAAWKVKELVIDTIITHGPDASVSGKIIRSDGSHFAFCGIYRFKGAGGFALNSITTFLIKK